MSMYLDERKPLVLKRNHSPRKRHAGEVFGPYELIKQAAEGPNADWTFWKARCLVCGEIVTVNIRQTSNLVKQKGCKYCRGQKPEAPSVLSTEGASTHPTK
jgi:hypothetical protein